jgi:hypothetical protein
MPRCERCGYELQLDGGGCPKCPEAAATGLGEEASSVSAEDSGPAEGGGRRPARARVGVAGAVVGAVYGAVVLLTYLLLDRCLFGGTETEGMGLLGVALLGSIGGGLLGAAIGAVTMVTRSTSAGILTGAIVLGVM